MKHALLPHGPWVYLPSGQRSRPDGPELLPGMQTVPGFYDDYLTSHNEQRYLLQLGFVDRLLGRLVARLKSQGMYDDTLIVVTADHGFAWQVGVPTRRSVSAVERERAGSGSAVREGAGPDARPGERRARADPRRDSHDRRRAERAARIPRRRPLGVLARGPRPPRGEPHQARLQLDRAHVGRALEGAAPRGRAAAPPPSRLGRLGEPLHEPRAEPRADRAGRDARTRSSAATRASISLSRSFARVRRSSGVVPCQIAGRIHELGTPSASATSRSP